MTDEITFLSVDGNRIEQQYWAGNLVINIDLSFNNEVENKRFVIMMQMHRAYISCSFDDCIKHLVIRTRLGLRHYCVKKNIDKEIPQSLSDQVRDALERRLIIFKTPK